MIRELEKKVIEQQTQKLQELGPTFTTKNPVSPMQETHSLGPMEEQTLDFEKLVLGKRVPPPSNPIQTSPKIAAFSTPHLQPSQPKIGSSRPSTPMDIMTPLQPTTSQTPPPLSSKSFFQPLQPTSFHNSSATTENKTLKGMLQTPIAPINASTINSSGAFVANPWSNSTLNPMSLPTIAPPPAKANPVTPMFMAQANQGTNANGLDKYQSLL